MSAVIILLHLAVGRSILRDKYHCPSHGSIHDIPSLIHCRGATLSLGLSLILSDLSFFLVLVLAQTVCIWKAILSKLEKHI